MKYVSGYRTYVATVHTNKSEQKESEMHAYTKINILVRYSTVSIFWTKNMKFLNAFWNILSDTWDTTDNFVDLWHTHVRKYVSVNIIFLKIPN